MAVTTTSNVEPTDREYFDMMLIEENRHILVLEQFANQKSIPKNHGSTINFRKRTPFPTVPTPMSEGVTPAARTMNITEQTASVYQFGDVAGITDWVDGTATDPVLNEITEEHSIQSKETREEWLRDELTDGIVTHLMVADTTSTLEGAAVANAASDIHSAHLDLCILTYKNAKAKPITEIVMPGTGYGSRPIGEAYVAVAHPNVIHDLIVEASTDWANVEEYANVSERMPYEVGKYRNIRFIESTHARVEDDGATDPNPNEDAFHTLIFAKDGWAVIGLDGQSTGTYHTPFGAGDDILHQRAYAGWKMAMGIAITNQLNVMNLVTTASVN